MFIDDCGGRYPNIACDLITSDVNEITEMLVTTESLLTAIYTFLEADDDLNPLQASFFSKVMGLLITRRSQMVKLLFFLQVGTGLISRDNLPCFYAQPVKVWKRGNVQNVTVLQ